MISGLIKKAKSLVGKKTSEMAVPHRSEPRTILRKDHSISRKDISENTLKVLYRLKKHGFQGYLVGGGVRDLLLNKHPKDFDVATDASPEEVKRIFSNCRLIGKRFRLAHVHFGRDIIEVATFRSQAKATHVDAKHSKEGMILRDNVYGTIDEDAWRRDFTINALYYNIADFSVLDFTGGMKDLKARKIRMIGDATTRFREDPVRMLRAIRFASKLDFHLSKDLIKPIQELKDLMNHVPPARLFEEMIKMFHYGSADKAFEALLQHELFEPLFPQTYDCLQDSSFPTKSLLKEVFQSTDSRVQQGKTITPVFIVAALLWHPILKRAEVEMNNGTKLYPARLKAVESCLSEQLRKISMPKRISFGAREVWLLQLRMFNRHGKRPERLIQEPRFRAAYDFLLLRAKAGEPVQELADWWEAYFEGDEGERRKLIRQVSSTGPNNRQHKRKTEEDAD
jgi:poly(A) polymerase